MQAHLDHQDIEGIFFGTWIVLGVGGLLFFVSVSPSLRRRAQPIAAVGVGLIFLLFAFLLEGAKGFYFAVIPVALITFINATTLKFCPNCGAMNRSPYIYPLPKYCNKCGTALDTPGTASKS